MTSSNNAINSSDKDVIIRLAVDNFNRQYNTDYDTADMDCYSIPTDHSRVYAYEVFTNRTDDVFRARMYLSLDGDETALGLFKLKAAEPNELTGDGDSVYVAVGTMDRHYIWTETFSLSPIQIDESNTLLDALLAENGEALTTESGENFILENAA